MHTDKPLYEPKLVEHWAKRYREFETAELVQQVSQAKAKMKERAGGQKSERKAVRRKAA